jgi:hypothetical protein
VAGGWIPGVGGAAAVAISTDFIWTMYGRINGKIDLPFSENIMKSVASGIATNLAGYAVASIAISTTFSLFPELGNVGASVMAGGTCYALTLASGFMDLKILTSIFKAGKDLTSITGKNLKEVAKKVIQNEDNKAVMKEAKKEYKSEGRGITTKCGNRETGKRCGSTSSLKRILVSGACIKPTIPMAEGAT